MVVPIITYQHILTTYVFARGVWFTCLSRVGVEVVTPSRNETSFAAWWRRRMRRDNMKGFHTLVMLGAWELWKQRNRCIFDGVAPNEQAVVLCGLFRKKRQHGSWPEQLGQLSCAP